MSTYRPLNPITHQQDVYGQPVTALSFDPVSDVLWAGSNTGTVHAYYGPQGMRGVSFPVGGTLAVKTIIAGDNYVRAHGLAGEGMGSWGKGGVNKWQFRPPANVTTFSNTSTSAHLIAVATDTPELLLLNSLTGSVVRKAPTPSVISHLQFSHSCLLSGSSDGFLRAHDPRTAMRREEGESLVRAHHTAIQGLQTSGNFVYTTGWSMRQSRPALDPLVKVYDVRTMRPLPPVPFQSGPAFIDVLPKRSSTIVVTSNEGLVNVVDVSNSSSSEFYQLDVGSYISSSAVSPTGAYMAFGDAEGLIHLLSAVDEEGSVPFNGFDGQPIEWADTPEALPEIEWTDSTPLNIIGMPYYDTQLLSSWTPQFVSTSINYPPPAKIPPQILNTMKMNDNVAYAAMPKELKGRRNLAVTVPRKDNGRFRSGKARKSEVEPDTPTFGFNGEEIPRMYQHVEIEYSKFGVEDFDFGFYNKTAYSGLETHILNSYTNPIVQVMHHCRPIRRLAKSHIATNCPREHCLLCELGFVVCMLQDASGINCQSSNFCKTVGNLAQAQNAIELIDYGRESTDVNYAHMIQSFNRFLIDHLSLEGNAFPHNPLLVRQPNHTPDVYSPAAAPITQLLGIDAKNIIVCMSCKAVREKENMTHIVDMIYPRKATSNEPPVPSDFASILRNSLMRQMVHKATCQTCKQFANFSSRRSIPTRDLPPLLAINASVYNDENMKFWLDSRNETFLKPHVEVRGQAEGVDDPECAVYALRSLVVQIVTKEKKSHLVAIVKVPDAEGGGDNASPWYLFNDFVVRNISEHEALSFPGKWKVPAVMYLERVDLQDNLDYSGLPVEMDPSILSCDTSISAHRDKNLIKHECLRFEELPRPGTLVAIDAEFVSMQQEEIEYRSDGTKKVLRPARLSLARVSVLRGDGSKQSLPFIDDHIHTSEVIVDYLTEFSGIKFGDLDPNLSPYTLTPLKLVYKKLRVLVDRGCIFIGHGLSKDFRIINIFVPPEQVIDTVDLYFIKARQRRLSLRFLAWFVLHENIQTDTHDSIEDARTALMLYKAYHAFEEEGTFDDKLEELYREGRQYNWKPPAVAGAPPASVAPAPVAPTIPQFAVRGNLLHTNFAPSKYPSSNANTPSPNFFSPSTSAFVPSWSGPNRQR
ncbi:hypothetical protein PLICRDRAFT_160474 [Plicaturopsis crispa FD-325 SS-3]|nr:hypothetical protein PLICRDRAFT_160474 [Plicaturopsis crispa FD-325 SS-3]